MIDNSEKNQFIQEFNKRFKNFCSRAPIYITFSIAHNFINIESLIDQECLTYKLDRNKAVEENIREIANLLKNKFYPKFTITETKKIEPSVEELNEYIRKNETSFDDAFFRLSNKKVIKNLMIDKLNIKRNQLIVSDTEENKKCLYKLKMPITVFLNKIKSMDTKEIGKLFVKEAKFLYEIKPEKSYN